MQSIDLIINPRDPVILRDGRPFGQSGTPQTGSLRWPRPGTVMGMARTYLGRLRDPAFFSAERSESSPSEAVKRLALEWYLPALRTDDAVRLCLPVPADAVAFPDDASGTRLAVRSLVPRRPQNGQGTDLPWKNWMYPWLEDERKPAKNAPLFWNWERYADWLVNGRFAGSLESSDLGMVAPEVEERTHVCIDPATGSAAESRLFTTLGLRFSDEAILASRLLVEDTDTPPRRDLANLGGDRRAVFLEWGSHLVDWPCPPAGLGTGPGLRLILITPGLFSGGWAPTALTATLADDSFAEIGATGVRGRLRSACVARWQPHHGWDMAIGKDGAPKPMRKLAPTGSVYFVELEPGTDVPRAVQVLWNSSLCRDEQDRRDGLGRILVGNWDMDLN